MRVTFLLPKPNMSGGMRVAAIHARNLARRGHDVTVAATDQPPPPLMSRAKRFVRTGRWPRHRLPSHIDHLGDEVTVIRCPRAEWADCLPPGDALVATFWLTAEWMADAPDELGARVYFVQHHEVFDNMPVDRVRRTWKAPFQKIAVSSWLADIARDEYGDNTCIVVPNAIDPAQFHAPPRGKQPRPTVGFVHAGTRWKGMDDAREAIDALRRALPDLRVVTFGALPPEPPYELPTAAEFTLSPPQDRLRNYYAACDCWLVSSVVEGYGLPILEAMACRTPVVTTRVGAAPELCADGGGIIVPPRDTAAMTDAMLRVLRLDEPSWRRMSDAAHTTATAYTWDDATERFEAALEQAAERAHAGREDSATP